MVLRLEALSERFPKRDALCLALFAKQGTRSRRARKGEFAVPACHQTLENSPPPPASNNPQPETVFHNVEIWSSTAYQARHC